MKRWVCSGTIKGLSLCTIEHLDGIEKGMALRESWRSDPLVVTSPILWCRRSHVSVITEYRAFNVPIKAGLCQGYEYISLGKSLPFSAGLLGYDIHGGYRDWREVLGAQGRVATLNSAKWP